MIIDSTDALRSVYLWRNRLEITPPQLFPSITFLMVGTQTEQDQSPSGCGEELEGAVSAQQRTHT